MSLEQKLCFKKKSAILLYFEKPFSNSLIIHKVNYKSLHVYHITCMCLDTV